MKKLLLLLSAVMLLCSGADADVRKGKGPRKKGAQRAKPTYYYNSDGSISEKPASATKARSSSAYKGDNVPENDGQRKNEQRNLNYNSGQPLPANNGKR